MALNWDEDANGNITLYPYLGYETGVGDAMVGLLRLEFARTPEQQRARSGEFLQLTLSPSLARSLAQALSRLADTIEARPPTRDTN